MDENCIALFALSNLYLEIWHALCQAKARLISTFTSWPINLTVFAVATDVC